MNTPTYYMVFYKDGKEYLRYSTKKRMRVYSSCTTEDFSECKLKVGYARGIHNEGTFTNSKDATQFIKECSEKDLLEYVAGGEFV